MYFPSCFIILWIYTTLQWFSTQNGALKTEKLPEVHLITEKQHFFLCLSLSQQHGCVGNLMVTG